MPLELTFCVTQACDCKSVTFQETTGVATPTYKTGWGSPNPEVPEDNKNVTLTVTTPSGTSTVIDLSEDGFPTDDTSFQHVITGADITGIGANANWPSGLYEFVYTVTVDDTVYTETNQYYFWCTLKCCVDKLFAGIDYDNCGCESDQFTEALEALALLRGVGTHANMGNYTEADAIKAKLEALCANSKYCNDC